MIFCDEIGTKKATPTGLSGRRSVLKGWIIPERVGWVIILARLYFVGKVMFWSGRTRHVASLQAGCDGRLCLYFLVAGNKYLHDNPADEVGDTTDAEYDEVACGFACEAHERHLSLGCVVKEDT